MWIFCLYYRLKAVNKIYFQVSNVKVLKEFPGLIMTATKDPREFIEVIIGKTSIGILLIFLVDLSWI